MVSGSKKEIWSDEKHPHAIVTNVDHLCEDDFLCFFFTENILVIEEDMFW